MAVTFDYGKGTAGAWECIREESLCFLAHNTEEVVYVQRTRWIEELDQLVTWVGNTWPWRPAVPLSCNSAVCPILTVRNLRYGLFGA